MKFQYLIIIFNMKLNLPASSAPLRHWPVHSPIHWVLSHATGLSVLALGSPRTHSRTLNASTWDDWAMLRSLWLKMRKRILHLYSAGRPCSPLGSVLMRQSLSTRIRPLPWASNKSRYANIDTSPKQEIKIQSTYRRLLGRRTLVDEERGQGTGVAGSEFVVYRLKAYFEGELQETADRLWRQLLQVPIEYRPEQLPDVLSPLIGLQQNATQATSQQPNGPDHVAAESLISRLGCPIVVLFFFLAQQVYDLLQVRAQ